MAVSGQRVAYSQAMADLVCEMLGEGKSLRDIAKSGDGMPAAATVCLWAATHPEFAEQYARAREVQADTLADEIVAIADEECTMVRANKHPSAKPDDEGMLEVVFDSTAVARNRLRVDARKWVAAKLKPKKYGDKVQQEVTGANGGPVETLSRVERIIVRPSNPDG
jgi:hypothetical protein